MGVADGRLLIVRYCIRNVMAGAKLLAIGRSWEVPL